MNKAVYTTTPVAGSWAGAVISWARAYSNTNFPTLKSPKVQKKQCVTDLPMEGQMDGQTW